MMCPSRLATSWIILGSIRIARIEPAAVRVIVTPPDVPVSSVSSILDAAALSPSRMAKAC
jgi:hypothetical protein